MQKHLFLKPGDQVEIIAPASRCSEMALSRLKTLLESWQLNCVINPHIFGDDLLCANSDEIRLNLLNHALHNSENKALVCVRGGYGCMRLIPGLSQIKPPDTPKLFIGMSDITALHLFLGQEWNWQTLHGSLTQDKFSPESIASLKSIIFGESERMEWPGAALNSAAKQNRCIEAPITGGNLTLVQASIGTLWQMKGDNKIIILEEITERAYRLDRMLEHLSQAGLFKNAAAIVFGDFLEGNEPNGTSLIMPVLERFAQRCHVPVIKIEGLGHGHTNFPVLFGEVANLHGGSGCKLTQQY